MHLYDIGYEDAFLILIAIVRFSQKRAVFILPCPTAQVVHVGARHERRQQAALGGRHRDEDWARSQGRARILMKCPLRAIAN